MSAQHHEPAGGRRKAELGKNRLPVRLYWRGRLRDVLQRRRSGKLQEARRDHRRLPGRREERLAAGERRMGRFLQVLPRCRSRQSRVVHEDGAVRRSGSRLGGSDLPSRALKISLSLSHTSSSSFPLRSDGVWCRNLGRANATNTHAKFITPPSNPTSEFRSFLARRRASACVRTCRECRTSVFFPLQTTPRMFSFRFLRISRLLMCLCLSLEKWAESQFCTPGFVFTRFFWRLFIEGATSFLRLYSARIKPRINVYLFPHTDQALNFRPSFFPKLKKKCIFELFFYLFNDFLIKENCHLSQNS